MQKGAHYSCSVVKPAVLKFLQSQFLLPVSVACLDRDAAEACPEIQLLVHGRLDPVAHGAG